MSAGLPEELLIYLRFLTAGARRGQYLDLRWRPPDGLMRRRLLPVGALEHIARMIVAHAPHSDLYVGACLRDVDRHGGRRAISGARMVFIECDRADALELLAAFRYPPSLVIESGTVGHVHAYWLLEGSASPEAIEAANRRLASALGGDLGSTEVARILRPPATFNHKASPPRPVRLIAWRPELRYCLADLTAGLPEESPTRKSRSSARARAGASALELALLALPAEDYARALAGAVANQEGKILCPFHAETVPSLQLYPDGGFFCFGCRRGGTIFDFAASLWGLRLRGRGFTETVARLADRFALGSPR